MPSPTYEPSLNPVFGSDKSCQLLSDGSFGKATKDRRRCWLFLPSRDNTCSAFRRLNALLIYQRRGYWNESTCNLFRMNAIKKLQYNVERQIVRLKATAALQWIVFYSEVRANLFDAKCSHVHNYILCLSHCSTDQVSCVGTREDASNNCFVVDVGATLHFDSKRPVLMLLRGQRWK